MWKAGCVPGPCLPKNTELKKDKTEAAKGQRQWTWLNHPGVLSVCYWFVIKRLGGRKTKTEQTHRLLWVNKNNPYFISRTCYGSGIAKVENKCCYKLNNQNFCITLDIKIDVSEYIFNFRVLKCNNKGKNLGKFLFKCGSLVSQIFFLSLQRYASHA